MARHTIRRRRRRVTTQQQRRWAAPRMRILQRCRIWCPWMRACCWMGPRNRIAGTRRTVWRWVKKDQGSRSVSRWHWLTIPTCPTQNEVAYIQEAQSTPQTPTSTTTTNSASGGSIGNGADGASPDSDQSAMGTCNKIASATVCWW